MVRATKSRFGNGAILRCAASIAAWFAAFVAGAQIDISLPTETSGARAHYLAGTKLLDGGKPEEAVQEFESALRLNDREGWSETSDGAARNDYFPRRELGVAHFKLGNLGDAEKWLRESLAAKDTARAHSYLDRVLEQQLAQGAAVDGAPPQIRTSIDGLTLTNADVLEFKVSVSDDMGVRAVSVNGKELYQRGSDKTVSFDHSLVPVDGDQIVRVEAWDLDGKHAEHEVALRVDRTGPVLGISSPRNILVTSADTERLAGSAADNDEVVSVTLNGNALALEREGGVSRFNADLKLTTGLNQFVVEAVDRAGNSTFTSVDVTRRAAEIARTAAPLPTQRHEELYAAFSP